MSRVTRMLLLALVLMVCAIAPAVQAQQQLPPAINQALQYLSTLVGAPVGINDLDQYFWSEALYTDMSLGCEFAVNRTPLPQPVSAYTFELTYLGTTVEIRVSADGSIIIPCFPSDGVQPLPFANNGQLPGGQVLATPDTASIQPCPTGFAGYLRPRLRVGSQARIETGGTPNRLRQTPSLTGAQIGVIQPGSTVTVIAGPSCDPQSVNGQANVIFWQVRTGSLVGWTAEGLPPNDYFLEAVGGTGLAAERNLISPQNAINLSALDVLALDGINDVYVSSGANNGAGLIAIAGMGGYAFYSALDLSPVSIPADPTYTDLISIAVSNDGRFVTFGKCGALYMFDTTSNATFALNLPTTSCVLDMAFIPSDGQLLAIGIGAFSATTPVPGSFGLLDLATLQSGLAPNLTNTPVSVYAVAFSPDASTVAYLSDQVHLINVETRGEQGTIALQSALPTGTDAGTLAFFPSPNAASPNALAIGDSGGVRLVNPITGQESIYELTPGQTAMAIAFSPDGRLLAVASANIIPMAIGNAMIDVFDTTTADTLLQVPLEAPVTSIAFSSDGTLLAVPDQVSDELLLLGIPG